MADATLAQGNELIQRILREKDSRGFLQSLIGNWGEVQQIGRRSRYSVTRLPDGSMLIPTDPREKEYPGSDKYPGDQNMIIPFRDR